MNGATGVEQAVPGTEISSLVQRIRDFGIIVFSVLECHHTEKEDCRRMCRPIDDHKEEKAMISNIPMRLEKGENMLGRDLNCKERGKLLRSSQDKMSRLNDHDLQKRIQIGGCLREVKRDIRQNLKEATCTWIWKM